jgi:hypothetical protein
MPTPKAGESEKDYVARCVPVVMREGKTQEQALGKCYGMYRNAVKSLGLKNPVADQVEDPDECRDITKLRGVLKLLLAMQSARVAKGLQVDAEQLYEGTVEEMEHTTDWRIAMKIALDHLGEDAEYYSKLRAAGLMGGSEK